MALLDKVSGELNLYIGGYVVRSHSRGPPDVSGPERHQR